MIKPILVLVKWSDAWVDGSDTVGLNDPDPKHGPTVMETIGWLLQDNESGVSLFNERCVDTDSDLYRSRTFIPRPLIHTITPFSMSKTRLKTAKPRGLSLEDSQ